MWLLYGDLVRESLFTFAKKCVIACVCVCECFFRMNVEVAVLRNTSALKQ